MEKEENQGKKCFIITSIGDNGSETFRMAKGVIESVIKPLLENYGYNDVKPAYEINESGMITTQIINRIIDDDLIICNLTGNNPNVMYELCLRHVVAKPIIHICQNGTTLPFDIKDNRTIFYKNDMLGVQELKNQMEDFLKGIDYSKEHKDNPVYNAIQMGILLKQMNDKGRQAEVHILEKILNEISFLKVKNTNNFTKNINPHIAFYKIYMKCNITDELFKIFKKNLSAKMQILPKYDDVNENVINFTLYNNEPDDINRIYDFVYKTARKSKIQGIEVVEELRFT